MKFEDLYDNSIYKYLDDDTFDENPTLLIPYIKEAYFNKRAYRKAYHNICEKYSTEYADNVLSMVADGTIGIYEPEQYMDSETNYSMFTNLDILDRLEKAVNTYEMNQFASIESLTALLVRAINEKMLEGRTDIRINYLIEAIAVMHKAVRVRNKNSPPRQKMTRDTIKNNMLKAIGLMIDTLSSTKGNFNPITIVIRDKFEWEANKRDIHIYLCDDITINYQEYMNMLTIFLRVFNKKCNNYKLNYPKIYINAKLVTNHHKNIYEVIYKYASSKYSYDDVFKSLLCSGVNITYTGIDIPAVKNKIREVLENLEIIEDVDNAVKEIYKEVAKKDDEIQFADDDLNYVLKQTVEGKLEYPHHKINRVYYTQKYGFCNWQTVLSVSYVNFKRLTRKDNLTYDEVKLKLTDAVINAQMLNMIKKFWYKGYSVYSACIVNIQYVPEKLMPMVADIVDDIITKMKSTYQTKFDYVLEDDRNFAYIENSIKQRTRMAIKQREEAEEVIDEDEDD